VKRKIIVHPSFELKVCQDRHLSSIDEAIGHLVLFALRDSTISGAHIACADPD